MSDPHSSSDRFYRRLDVGPQATHDEIVHAYRRLAHGAHPDAHPGDPDAARRFREITEAYEVLADPSRRATYDRTRDVGPIRVIVRPHESGFSPTPRAARVWADAEPTVFLGATRSPIGDVPLWAGPARVDQSTPGPSMGGGRPEQMLVELIGRIVDAWGRR